MSYYTFFFIFRKNQEITLNDFKFIWWMEYGHRQWGRIIGGFFLLPATIFWYKGWFTKALKKRVVACGGLILLQVKIVLLFCQLLLLL